jgi:hypothetical protein
MQLPGFTAEIVLHQRRNENHTGSRVSNGMQGAPGVLAQLRIVTDPIGQCFSRCFLNGGTSLECFFACDPVTVRQFSNR